MLSDISHGLNTCLEATSPRNFKPVSLYKLTKLRHYVHEFSGFHGGGCSVDGHLLGFHTV
jgi:hypothetical protein